MLNTSIHRCIEHITIGLSVDSANSGARYCPHRMPNDSTVSNMSPCQLLAVQRLAETHDDHTAHVDAPLMTRIIATRLRHAAITDALEAPVSGEALQSLCLSTKSSR